MQKVRYFECSLWMSKPSFGENGHRVDSSCNIFWFKYYIVLIRCALEALSQENTLNTLNVITRHSQNFLEPLKVKKFMKNDEQIRNFEYSFWVFKAKFCENGHWVVLSCNIFWLNHQMDLILCALESPEFGEYFKYLECYHTTLTKVSRNTQSQKIHEKRGENQKFRILILDVQNKVLWKWGPGCFKLQYFLIKTSYDSHSMCAREHWVRKIFEMPSTLSYDTYKIF